MNKSYKIVGIVIIILFLSLFFSKYNYNYNENKSILTEEAIKRYEQDLKEGKEINPSNYRVPDKNYNNKASKVGVKASQIIEKVFKKGMKYIMNSLKKLEE